MEIQSMKMAQKAKELVQGVSGNKEDYLRFARGLGSMIVQNGLAGTLVFLKQKGQDEVINHLRELVGLQSGSTVVFDQILAKGALQIDAREYLKSQSAALDATKWLKRYAEIILGNGSDKNDEST